MSSDPFQGPLPFPSSRVARLFVGLVGLTAAGLAMGGCPGSLEDPSRFTGGSSPGGAGACPDIETELFPQTCTDGQGPCHSAADAVGGIDLESPGMADRLAGQTGSTSCGNAPLLDPDNPTDSVIYDVLLESSCSAFGQMPFGQDPLTQAQIDCVEQWVADQSVSPTTTSTGMGGGGMGGAGGLGGAGGMGGAGGAGGA